MGLADGLGPFWPRSITSESSHAPCLRCWSTVAWSGGSWGWPTPWSRPAGLYKRCVILYLSIKAVNTFC